MLSLNARVLIAASAILAAFFSLAGFTLDRAYRLSSQEALIKRLEVQVYALIALAAIDDAGNVYMPDAYTETSFLNYSPDTYARISDPDGRIVWSSPTPVGINLPYKVRLTRNQTDFSYATVNQNFSVAIYSHGIAWHDQAHKVYTFSVAEKLDDFNRQVTLYRRNLWGLLGGVALLLLVVQGAIIRWGLAPLDRVSGELVAIEAGRKQRLSENYPGELKGLTDNVNALLGHQQDHLERYRHTLGDLAHSLKTPLAVLQSTLDEKMIEPSSARVIQEQLDRITQISEYQLQRAATAGQSPLIAPVDIDQTIQKVVNSLSKVYADKNVKAELDIDKGIVFHGDEGDLMEVMGNLTDNAFKYCRQRVRITAKMHLHDRKNLQGLLFSVEDDGPGVPDEMVKHVVQRGVRVDQGISGHGIGLSVVQDIAQIYGGELNISSGAMGGALVSVWLPEKR
ncbi:MAG: ATP-binding protein [Gammaproteobacteria bacterium]|nr:ATP-binding protein [Gammaproteobacteria bacterium]